MDVDPLTSRGYTQAPKERKLDRAGPSSNRVQNIESLAKDCQILSTQNAMLWMEKVMNILTFLRSILIRWPDISI